MLTIDLIILFFASVLTFVLFGYDKHLAVYNKSRIPEAVLLVFSFLGGAFGALCAMWMFRHKTQKPLFRTLVPIFLVLQLVGDILLRLF